MRALTRSLGFVTDVARHVNALGWDIYATDHEDANGQFEQNFQFDDALVTCDRAIFFRYMVESLAQERGLIATFMPKPFADLTGNGCHFHMSLWEGDRNLFDADPADDPRGLGLTQAGLPLHRRPAGAREGLHRGDRADGQLLQAAEGRRPALGRDVGAGLRLLRLQQPHADAARAGAGPRRGPHRGRLLQSLPRGHRAARRGTRRDRARARPGRPEHAQPVRVDAGAARGAGDRHAAGEPARRHARARARRRDPQGARHARAAATTSTTSSSASGARCRPRTSRSRRGSSTATCSSSEPMCGIVGLFAKSPDVELRLGALLGEMLGQLADRGPDSAGHRALPRAGGAGSHEADAVLGRPGRGLGGARRRHGAREPRGRRARGHRRRGRRARVGASSRTCA